MRPRGDWPTIIGTCFGFLALAFAVFVYFFPPGAPSGKPAPTPTVTQPARAAPTVAAQVGHADVAPHSVVLVACAFVVFVFAVLYFLSFRPNHILALFLIALAGTFYETFFWSSMNLWGRLFTIAGIIVLFALSEPLSEVMYHKKLTSW
jgi:magnesium-transporting ATPase (P-type)